MGFLSDAWDTVKAPVATVMEVSTLPFTAAFGAVARNTQNVPLLGTVAQGLTSVYQWPTDFVRGNQDKAKQGRTDAIKGGAVAGAAYLGGAGAAGVSGGLVAGTSTEGAASAYDKTGKLDARTLAQLGMSTYGDGDFSNLFKTLSAFDQVTGVPTSTTNPYVYATGMPATDSTGYDSSYLDPNADPEDDSLLFYGAMAAGAFFILLAAKGKK